MKRIAAAVAVATGVVALTSTANAQNGINIAGGNNAGGGNGQAGLSVGGGGGNGAPGATGTGGAAMAQPGQFIYVVSAGSLISRPIEDQNGHDAGQVNSLVLNIATGDVEFVLVSGRGDLNLNGRLIAIPWSIIVPPTTKNGPNAPLRVQVAAAKLAKAPRINPDAVYQLSMAQTRANVYGYWGYPNNVGIGYPAYRTGYYGYGNGAAASRGPAGYPPAGAVAPGPNAVSGVAGANGSIGANGANQNGANQQAAGLNQAGGTAQANAGQAGGAGAAQGGSGQAGNAGQANAGQSGVGQGNSGQANSGQGNAGQGGGSGQTIVTTQQGGGLQGGGNGGGGNQAAGAGGNQGAGANAGANAGIGGGNAGVSAGVGGASAGANAGIGGANVGIGGVNAGINTGIGGGNPGVNAGVGNAGIGASAGGGGAGMNAGIGGAGVNAGAGAGAANTPGNAVVTSQRSGAGAGVAGNGAGAGNGAAGANNGSVAGNGNPPPGIANQHGTGGTARAGVNQSVGVSQQGRQLVAQGLVVGQNGVIQAMQSPHEVSTQAVTASQVHARNGDELGYIDQVLIDPVRGRIAFVLLQRGGFLGLDPTWFAVPVEALTWAPYQGGYRLTANERLLASERPIRVNTGNLPSRIPTQDLASLYRHFGLTPYWQQQNYASSSQSGNSTPGYGQR